MLIKHLPYFVFTLPLVLAACTSQTSIERNATHAVSAIESIEFDPNTRLLKTDSINAMKPLMQQFYDLGKKDRADGITLTQAQKRVENFRSTGTLIGGEKDVVFGREYDADNPEKQRQIVISAGTAAYWDGYNGKL